MFRFAVVGRGPFPIDMLRYDIACPWQEVDSGLIEDLDYQGFRVVFLDSFKASRLPTFERWASFGWLAVEIDAIESREANTRRILELKEG